MNDKLKAAVEWLGERHVFHPARHVKRGSYKMPEVHKVNVAKTFAKIRKQLQTGEVLG